LKLLWIVIQGQHFDATSDSAFMMSHQLGCVEHFDGGGTQPHRQPAA
jgi:hypothetical protein